MSPSEDCVDNVGCEQGEAVEPRHIAGHDAFGLGDLVQRQVAIRDQALADRVRANQQAHQARIGDGRI